MTSPAPVLESDRRVLKRPWILEKSWPATVVISSMASWLVTDYPHAAGALRAQVLDDGLEVEHEARVGADVLAHLVHHEQQAAGHLPARRARSHTG